MSTSKKLEGKTIVITGCNRGIGLQMVDLFAKNRAKHIIACVRTQTEQYLNHCNELSAQYSTQFTQINIDMANAESVKIAMKQIHALKTPIDVLVNNAGVAHGSLLQMTSMKELKEVFEINFFSQVLIIQHISKLMLRQKSGSIICLASIAGMDSYAGYTAYGSSKAAIIYAVKTISQEIAPYGVRINAISPGLTETNMAQQMENKAFERMVGASGMKRLAKPQEIAEVALFLASEESSFVCGQNIRVDGGM